MSKVALCVALSCGLLLGCGEQKPRRTSVDLRHFQAPEHSYIELPNGHQSPSFFILYDNHLRVKLCWEDGRVEDVEIWVTFHGTMITKREVNGFVIQEEREN